MNYTCTTVIVLFTISMIVNILLLAMFLNQRKNNIQLKGAYTFKTKSNNYNKEIIPLLDRLDIYLKEILDRHSKICDYETYETKIPYEKSDDIKAAFDRTYKQQIPESFIPDYIFSYIDKSDKVKTYYIVEFDEGNNFHSSENDIKYVYKWLNYNRMLIDRKDYLVIIRITYPDTGFWKTNTKEKTNEILMIINFIVNSLYGYVMGCYCLYKMEKDITKDNKLVIVETKTIEENIDESPNKLYKMEKDESGITINEILKDEKNNIGLLKGGITEKPLIKRKSLYDHPLYKGSPTRNRVLINSYNLEMIINSAIHTLKTSIEEDFMYVFKFELVNNENDLNKIKNIETRNNARIYKDKYRKYYEKFGKLYYKPMTRDCNFDDYNLFPYIEKIFDDYLKELEQFQNMEDKEPYKIYVNLMIILLASLKCDGFLTNGLTRKSAIDNINKHSKQISNYEWFIEKHKDVINVDLLNYLRE